MKYGHVETEKLYFSSSEAAEQVGVSADILHAWEKEFKELKPKKNRAGKRIYRQTDIEIAKAIKAGAIEPNSPKPQKTRKSKSEAGNAAEMPQQNTGMPLQSIRDNLQSALNRLRVKRN